MKRHRFTIPFLTMLLLSHFVDCAQAGTPTTDTRDYSNKDMTDVNFLRADLRGANFSGADIRGAMFAQANLTDANFRNAIVGNSRKGPTDFSQANLTRANFQGVKVESRVSFQYADITSANFSGIDSRNILFGPILYFNHSETPPKFAHAIMSCEFPWHWRQLDLSGAKLPACENQLAEPKDRADAKSGKSAAEVKASSSDRGTASNLKIPKPNSMVLYRDASLKLAGSYKANAATGNQVYVTTNGADSTSCGTTVSNACLTIQQGISNCNALGASCNVLVGYGAYTLTQTIQLANNISLAGGYVNGASSVYQSSITAPSGGVPAFTGTAVTLNLQNFIVTGTTSGNWFQATVVMQLLNTNGVTLSNVNINAATAGTSAPAANQGTASNGGAGSNYNATNPGAGGASSCSTYNAGGAAGTSWNITSTSTGWGGFNCTGQCSFGTSNQWYGLNGGGSNPGAGTKNSGSACSWGGPPPTPAGGAGAAGPDANTAAVASPNRIGAFDGDGNWGTVEGSQGYSGYDGGGGGGGGAGLAVAILHCPAFKDTYVDTYNGVAGGGGGAGGCGATGGGSGGMGPASFGMVLVNSSPIFGAGSGGLGSSVTITGAQGGSGGSGGAGVMGGTGGAGGANCNCQDSFGQAVAGCTPNCNGAGFSGAGGNGGNGGASGGGAGGNGGPSICVVLIGTSTIANSPTYYPGASGLAGAGGAGAGSAPPGAGGQAGLAQAVYTVTP